MASKRVSDDGDQPLPGAVEDLRALNGGKLARGSYRFIEFQGPSFRSGVFSLGDEGELLD
jgi:hypothetical protein